MSASLPWAVFEYAEVGSTQDVAKEKLDGSVVAPFMVRADHQTAGRGRAARSWSSLAGNLQSTLVLPMGFDTRYAANFSFLTAVALSETVCGFCDGPLPKIEHKWPNDVWVNDRKLAGVLLEVYKDHLLIGTGVNIAAAPDGAIALHDVVSSDITPSLFLERFLSWMDVYRKQMIEDGFCFVREKWLVRARGIGGEITVRTPNETFQGVFDGIEEDGALRVLIGQDMRIIHSADVFF